MSLLNHNEGDCWFVIRLNLGACLPHRHQFFGQNHQKLPLAATISIHDNLLRLPASILIVKFQEKVLGDLLHVLDDFLGTNETHVLNPYFYFIVSSPANKYELSIKQELQGS